MLIAALMGLFSLPFASFMADDFIQLGFLERVLPGTWSGPLSLYTISDGILEHVQVMKDAGAFPWFFGPTFKMVFFRPLSSALLALDHALFGLHPAGYRVHTLLWFLLLVAGLGTLFRRVLAGPLGTLALLIFTISGIHGILCWTAARHIVIAAAIGVLSLLCHVRWRQEGWRPGRVLSIGGFALSLTAGEAAVGVIAYLFAYEAFGAPGNWKNRLRACVPVLGLIACYLLLYRTLGFGASGGSGYINPLVEPLVFLVRLPGRLLVLAGAAIFGGSADLWVLRPAMRTGMIIGGAVFVLLLTAILRTVWPIASAQERKAVRWLVFGALASAVPFAGTPIGSRCLIVPFIGGAAALALVIHRWWTFIRRRPGAKYRLVGAGCAFLALLHLVIAPIQQVSFSVLLHKMMHGHLVSAMKKADLDPERIGRQSVIVLKAPDLAVGFHSYYYRKLYQLPMPASWRVLSWAPCGHRFRRTAGDTLEMELTDGRLEAPQLTKGAIIQLNGMRATVLGTDRIGVNRVEFRFNGVLDDPSFCFLAWREGRLQRVDLPPVGEALLLP